MGFDESRVRRASAGTSAGGQFASLDRQRVSAGQVEAFDEDAEARRDERLREVLDQMVGTGALDASSWHEVEDALASGDFVPVQRDLLDRYGAELESMADAATLDRLMAERLPSFDSRLDASWGFYAMDAGNLGTGDAAERLTEVAARYGADVHNPELASRIRTVAERGAARMGPDTPVQVHFDASLGDVAHTMGTGGTMNTTASMQVGQLTIPLGECDLPVRAGIESEKGSWLNDDDVALYARSQATDEHHFHRHTGYTTESGPDGSTIHRQSLGHAEMSHAVHPDGSQTWEARSPGFEHVEQRLADGTHTVRSTSSIDQTTTDTVTRPDGRQHTRSTGPLGTVERMWTPDGSMSETVTGPDGSMRSSTQLDGARMHHVEKAGALVVANSTLEAKEPGLVTGVHRSQATGGAPVEVRIERPGDRRAAIESRGVSVEVAASEWESDIEVSREALLRLDDYLSTGAQGPVHR